MILSKSIPQNWSDWSRGQVWQGHHLPDRGRQPPVLRPEGDADLLTHLELPPRPRQPPGGADQARHRAAEEEEGREAVHKLVSRTVSLISLNLCIVE